MTNDIGRLTTARALIEQEMAALDERRWDDWLSLYSRDCEFWMPMWRDEETLTDDPQRELSHIYYRSRAGLEDRVLRIKSQSASSLPLPRTVHAAGWIFAEDAASDNTLVARNSWTCQVFRPSTRETALLFGLSRYEFLQEDGIWRITRRKIQLDSDYIPTMADIFCL